MLPPTSVILSSLSNCCEPASWWQRTYTDRREECLQQPRSLVILSSVSAWMFCPGKEQLSRATAAAHSVSRWINQSAFQFRPSISGNNLGDIIKVPFCHSRGQGATLLFPLTLYCNSYRGKRSGLNETQISELGSTVRCLLVFSLFRPDNSLKYFLLLWLNVKQEFFQHPSLSVCFFRLLRKNSATSTDLNSGRIITHHLPYITHLASHDDGVFST